MKSHICAGVLLSILAIGLPAAAQSDDEQTVETGWWWMYNATLAQVDERLGAGFRITDIEIAQVSPIRFNAVFVHNSGAYAKTWWWYYDATGQFIADRLTENNARLIDLDPYEASGETRMAAVMIRNTGADQIGWWWVFGWSFNDLVDFLNENPARIIDLDTYFVGGTRYYSAVMVHNSGSFARGWWWYANVTTSFIADKLRQNNARVIDIERYSSTTRFSVVMQALQGEHWWWYFGKTDTQVGQLISQNGARLIDLESYPTANGTRFAVAMLNNANDLTTRIGDIFRSTTDGDWGLLLKRIGGPVLANVQKDYVFEPASMIKILHHTHAMLKVQAGTDSLAATVLVYLDMIGSCPQDTNPTFERLDQSLRLMMENSDNNRTQAMRVRFGESNINQTAQDLGMTDTLIQHRLGCAAGPDAAHDEPNQLTLDDAAALYEAAATGLLNDDLRAIYYNLMVNSRPTLLNTIITQEANAAGLSSTQRESFRNLVGVASKGGSYGLCFPSCIYHQTRGGWSTIPFRNGCARVPREYFVGTFVNNATNNTNASNAASTARSELLRDEIRAAARSWTNCPFDQDGDGDVDRWDFAAFLDCYTGPGGGPPDPGCEGFNTSRHDDDIDFADWAAFQRAVTGE